MTSDGRWREGGVQGSLWVTWGQFQIADGENWPVGSHWGNGLISPEAGGAVIATGVHTGPVRLTVDVRDSPPELQTGPWEEVVECTVNSLSGWLHVVAEGGDLDVFPTLSSHGPGHYRVRCHARGRDVAFDAVVAEPVEEYLLQVWPGRPGQETVHKQTDERGRNLRLSAVTSPNPDIMRALADASQAESGRPFPAPSQPDTEIVIPQRADPSAGPR